MLKMSLVIWVELIQTKEENGMKFKRNRVNKDVKEVKYSVLSQGVRNY